MPILTPLDPACAAVGADAVFPSPPLEYLEYRTARFTTDWGPSGPVIAVHGELDASNANQLAHYVQRCATHSRSLILNLRGVEFFGTAGFSALHTINAHCAGTHVRWAVAPSRAVFRLLRICDPHGVLPIAESAAAAVNENDDTASTPAGLAAALAT
jgi:anti-anti-sigma factor